MTDLTYEELMAEVAPDPIIPFGKHRGKYAGQIDIEYLEWLIGQQWVQEPLKGEIRDHLETRKEPQPWPQTPTSTSGTRRWI